MGRSVVAAIMLVSFPEFLNILAEVTDSISAQIGSLNEFKLVLSKMGDQVSQLTWSWTSVKQMTIVAISFLSFFVLYVSVYVADAIYLYSWTLLFIFSPILIALYVLPQTAGATRGLYSSIFHVASWKLIWSVLATLLWSAALMDIEKLGASTDFLTIILFNLMLAGSLLLTPILAMALIGGGVSKASSKLSGVAMGAGAFAMGKVSQSAPMQKLRSDVRGMPSSIGTSLRGKYYSYRDNRAIRQNPSLKTDPLKLPSAVAEQNQEARQLKKMDQEVIRKLPYKRYMPKSLPSQNSKFKKKT